MARSPFHLRFGFAGWLYHLRTGRAPKYSEIGRIAERTGVAVAAWNTAEEPPPDWKVHEPLAQFLGVEERWLIRDQGDPPEPQLWRRWVEERSVQRPTGPAPRAEEPDWKRVAREHELEVATQPAEVLIKKVPEKKTAAGGKRPRKR